MSAFWDWLRVRLRGAVAAGDEARRRSNERVSETAGPSDDVNVQAGPPSDSENREEEALLRDLAAEGVLTEGELARLLEARRRFRGSGS